MPDRTLKNIYINKIYKTGINMSLLLKKLINKPLTGLITAILFAASAQVSALEISDLKFVSGADPANYSSDGKPNATYSIQNTLPADVLTNIYSLLPESSIVNPDFIATNKASSIAIDNDLGGAPYAEVSVTFLNEGAGYRNSLGYFIYQTDSPPQTQDEIFEHIIIFPNASKPVEGSLLEGDTLDLNIQVLAGHTISFFVIPNGWGYSGSFNNIESFGPWNTPFYSLPELNPESTVFNRRHNVAFIDTVNQFVVIGFEDLLRPWGDNDFNDILFTVNVTPFSAIDGVNVDGSTNGNYEVLIQNNNPDVLMTTISPAANVWGTVAFEDNWPVQGDYDFNDVVMRYRITEIMNGQLELTSIDVTFQLQAMGGDYHNGFALRLPNVDVANISSVTLAKNGVAAQHEVIETGHDQTILIISPDTHADVINLGQITEACPYYHVEQNCIDIQTGTIEYKLSVVFTTPVSQSVIGQPPYDPFIFAAAGKYHGDYGITHPGRSWETHLKQFSGTPMFDASLYTQGHDATDGINYFVTANAFPWAINLSEDWQQPLERIDLVLSYPDFADWVTSSGQNNLTWHKVENAMPNKIAQ